MSTQNVGFIVADNAVQSGGTVLVAGSVVPMNGTSANQAVEMGFATRLDVAGPRPQDAAASPFDLSQAGYAKNAGIQLTLTGTTAITLDFTAIAAATGVVIAGDTSFASYSALILTNNGSQTLTVAQGGSNPLRLQFGSGTLTLAPGDQVALFASADLAVDSTHKTLLVTPTSGGSLGIAIGGA